MLNIKKFIPNEEKISIINMFFTNENKKYIMGRSRDGYAKELSQLVEIDGFIDDFTKDSTYLNKPIVKTIDVQKDSIIIVCSTVRTRTAYHMLKEKGFKYVIDYPTFFKHKNHHDLKLRIINGFDFEFETHKEKYETLYSMLNDSLSQQILEELINYRLTCELDYMKNLKFDQIGQYFEDFLDLQDNEVFVDAGGYDGQTSRQFINHCPTYKSIYIFEPSKENLALAEENLKNFKNINFISKGLSNQKDTLRFDTGSGSASSISENGTIEIEVDTLDRLVNEQVTFIKMDIEGAEALAIEGMRNHILNDYPKMAISVYHKVDDLWQIPEQIFTIRNDYDIYLRHYTEGTDETVMFFIPNR